MNNTWECKNGDSEWTFNFNTCSWVTVQGSKSLIEVRENHNSNNRQSSQSFLGM